MISYNQLIHLRTTITIRSWNIATQLQLTVFTFTNFLNGEINMRPQVDAIYTDYYEAFNRVIHYILLPKLIGLGILSDLYKWIASYVSNRHKITVANGFASQLTDIVSGVLQGSHFGTLIITRITSLELHTKCINGTFTIYFETITRNVVILYTWINTHVINKNTFSE